MGQGQSKRSEGACDRGGGEGYGAVVPEVMTRSSLLPLPFLQPAWFLMIGGDRSFKLALIEKDK